MYNRLALVGIVVLGLVAGSAHAELVGHWRLNEGAGAIAYDSSGNGNDGAVQGEPEWVAGMLGGALLLNGVDDYVEIPHSQILTVDNEVTVMAWVNAEAYTGVGGAAYQGIIAKSNGPRSYSLYLQGAGTLHFSTAGAGSSSSETVPLNEWVHVTAQVAGGEHRYFLNGEAAGSGGSGIVLPGTADTANVLIGNTWEDNREFAGMIDDARIYNHALDETELQEAMTNIPFPLPMALALDPADGTMIGQPQYTLKWMGGDLAASHVVYLGESFDEVDQGLVEAVDTTEASLATTSIPAYAAGLTPGQTYYWRVDEVNDLHPESPWKGNVWSFQVQPLTAWNPSPADGMKYIPTDQQLTWEKGIGALFHTVYFGESFEEVNTATESIWMTPNASFDPGVLENDKTYYWRIDEFAGTTTHKGPVWSFTTRTEITVGDPDLVGWWTLDEGMGLTALDWSGNGNDGTLMGGPQWTDGYLGGALEFSVGKYVDCGVAAAGEVTNDFTMTAWAKLAPGSAGVYGGIGGRLTRTGDPYYGFSLVRHSSNKYRLWIGDGTGDLAKSAVSSDVQYTDTEWHHVAGVREGQANALYIDGVRQAASTNTGFAASPEWFHIGRQYSHLDDRYFAGTIDDVRIYNKALTEAELAQAMRGNPLLAGAPNPGPGAVVDIRDALALSWVAGDTAASHGVYFGTDKAALELQGNQPGTSFSLAGLVEMGGGDYFWRIDEVQADGAVQTGYVWRFHVPDYLVVDDFESYNNELGSRPFEKWIDGVGFTQPEPGNPGNGTGAAVGHDIWSEGTPHTMIMETGDVYAAGQSMPIYYTGALSEANRTFVPGQNWTAEGVTTLVMHFLGEADNTGTLYVEINGVRVPYDGDSADIASTKWIAWEIDLASVGTNLANVTTLTIGVENGTGVLYVDHIILTQP